MPEAPVLMVGTDQELVEASLVRKQLGCPGCGEVLGPWGHARGRVLVRRGGREDRCAHVGGGAVPVGGPTSCCARMLWPGAVTRWR